MSTSTQIRQRTSNNNPKGFDKLGFSVFPDCTSEIEIPFINRQFQIGMDDPEKKEYFENMLGVRFDTLEGQDFLDNYRIKLNHEVTIFGGSPYSEFDIHVIKANKGFGLIKMDDNEDSPMDSPIFEFFDEEKDLDAKVTKKSTINRTIGQIETLWEDNRPRLVLIAKYLFDINAGITSEKAAYDKLTGFITDDSNQAKNAENAKLVLRALNADPEFVTTTVNVKQAIAKGIIRHTDGYYVNHATQTRLGRNLEDAINFCNNLLNQDEYGTGGSTDAPHTILAQLKNSLR